MMRRFPIKSVSAALLFAVLGCGEGTPAVDADASKGDASKVATETPGTTGKARRQTSLGNSPSTQRVD